MSFFLHLLSQGLSPHDSSAQSLWSMRNLPTTHSLDQHQVRHAEAEGKLEQALHLYQQALASNQQSHITRDRAIAVSLALGKTSHALKLYRQQMGNTLSDHLTAASLLLQDQQHYEAAREIRYALGVVMNRQQLSENINTLHNAPETRSPEQTLQLYVKRGNRYLTANNFSHAQEMYAQALRLTDSLLTAHGLWLIAEHDPIITEPIQAAIIQWANLGDQLLRCLAKTTLAENLAGVLQQRHLRSDLASWATTADEVMHLLTMERERLTALTHAHPNHAEMHYRLGVLARATDDYPTAITCFRHVLQIHPHHAATSVRLAATLLQQNQPHAARRILEQMHPLSPATLRQYHALALAATNTVKFEQTLSQLEQQPQHRHSDLRANLAFTLTAMGAKQFAPTETPLPMPAAK